MSERMNNPERIYLEPPPYSPEGRQWCADDVRERVRQAVEWGIEDAWPRYNRIYDPHDPDDESRQEWVDCITEQVVTALLRTPRGEGEAAVWALTTDSHEAKTFVLQHVLRYWSPELQASLSAALRSEAQGEGGDFNPLTDPLSEHEAERVERVLSRAALRGEGGE